MPNDYILQAKFTIRNTVATLLHNDCQQINIVGVNLEVWGGEFSALEGVIVRGNGADLTSHAILSKL